MKDLPFLVSTFSMVEDILTGTIADAEAAGDQIRIEQGRRRQRVNEQAYYLLCWGQLETEIDETCRRAIRAGQSEADWRKRRVWDLYNPDERRLSGLSFEDRTALVLNRGQGRGGPWSIVMRYYALRNQIAHGTLQSGQIDLAAVVADFYLVQGALDR